MSLTHSDQQVKLWLLKEGEEGKQPAERSCQPTALTFVYILQWETDTDRTNLLWDILHGRPSPGRDNGWRVRWCHSPTVGHASGPHCLRWGNRQKDDTDIVKQVGQSHCVCGAETSCLNKEWGHCWCHLWDETNAIFIYCGGNQFRFLQSVLRWAWEYVCMVACHLNHNHATLQHCLLSFEMQHQGLKVLCEMWLNLTFEAKCRACTAPTRK